MPNTKHAYEHVWGIYLPIAILVFAIVLGALVVLVAAGARRSRPGRRSEALAVEIGYVLALAGVTAFLVWVTFRAETPIDRLVAHPSVRIKVIAAQWSWRFIYSNGVQVVDVSTWHPSPAVCAEPAPRSNSAAPRGRDPRLLGSGAPLSAPGAAGLHDALRPRLSGRRALPGGVLGALRRAALGDALRDRCREPGALPEWLAREGARVGEGSPN